MEDAAVDAVLTLIVVVPIVVSFDGPPRFGRACVFAVLENKVMLADPESPDAATEIPCGLMQCQVVDVVAVMLPPLTLSTRTRGTDKFRACDP